jgi:hypothetical protein
VGVDSLPFPSVINGVRDVGEDVTPPDGIVRRGASVRHRNQHAVVAQTTGLSGGAGDSDRLADDVADLDRPTLRLQLSTLNLGGGAIHPRSDGVVASLGLELHLVGR